MISIGKVEEWLENHSHGSSNVLARMITATPPSGAPPVVAAQWPMEVAGIEGVFAAATASFRGRKSHFRAEPHSNEKQPLPANVITLPLHTGNHAVDAIASKLNAGYAEAALCLG